MSAATGDAAPHPSAPQPGPKPDLASTPPTQPIKRPNLLDTLAQYPGARYHWARRFVALVLDVILVLVPVYAAMTLLDVLLGLWWMTGALGVVLFLYSAFLESSTGSTLGKAILGLKVVSKKGQKLELGDALVRNVTKIHGVLLLLEFVASLATETVDAHQRFMDKIANTTVVEKA